MFPANMNGRMGRNDRNPNYLKIMPGTFPRMERYEAEVQDKCVAVQELIHPVAGRSLLERLTGADLPANPHEAPLRAMPATDGGKSRQGLFFSLAQREEPTIRELSLCGASTRVRLGDLERRRYPSEDHIFVDPDNSGLVDAAIIHHGVDCIHNFANVTNIGERTIIFRSGGFCLPQSQLVPQYTTQSSLLDREHRLFVSRRQTLDSLIRGEGRKSRLQR